MNKPTPKYELVIKIDGNLRLFIYPSTVDAAGWIDQEARAFGNLYDQLELDGSLDLFVHPFYDIQEVALYLARMGGEDTDASLVTLGNQTLYPIPPTETPEQPS